ncbi:hypothetical protein [Paracoccus sp. (in: a-proteobacteria)]|uniref:hypothetical protein n=1 Tax=Paracoccus sp. TaxID=267 RepID=UPI003A88392E
MNMTSARSLSPAAPAISPAAMPVTIAPSRRELRRADPSLSFQVSAPGMAFFDVIVATDPLLFSPDQAHRRTPRNFRSSRQDFEGMPIETETGLYMLPSAFLRDAISQDPRPVRLHYLAVAYADQAARDGILSQRPDSFADAPFVLLGADLSARSLAHVLGMAVHRLGTVNARGRVMTAMPELAAGALPRMIGGLPVDLPRHGGGAMQRPAVPAPVPAPLNGPSPVNSPSSVAPRTGGAKMPPVTGNSGTINGPTPVTHANGMGRAPVPATPMRVPPATGGGFVDDDYAFGGGGGGGGGGTGFRDMDSAGPGRCYDGYDDGLGPMPDHGGYSFSEDAPAPQAEPAPPTEPIPPLDDVPSATPAPAAAAPLPAPQRSGEGWKDTLVSAVIAEGAGGRYEAFSFDGAFRGRLGETHPNYRRAHDGLSMGPHQANQDSGELGQLLSMMQDADPAGFSRIFGPAASELLRLTNAEGPASAETQDGRGARIQMAEGADLWEEPWVSRFRQAAAHPPFQAAMRAQIVANRLDPMIPAAQAMGFEGVRGVAMLLALAIHVGVPLAIDAARKAVNPFDTPARLAPMLEAVQADSLAAFQTAHDLPASGQMDAATHFALLAALRAMGADAPVPLPDPETAMDMLVTAVGPGPVGDALLKLRVSGNFRQTANG